MWSDKSQEQCSCTPLVDNRLCRREHFPPTVLCPRESSRRFTLSSPQALAGKHPVFHFSAEALLWLGTVWWLLTERIPVFTEALLLQVNLAFFLQCYKIYTIYETLGLNHYHNKKTGISSNLLIIDLYPILIKT